MTTPGRAARLGNRIASSDAAFARLAWVVYAYVLLVIVGGAIVRITGSGAGCGQHWPTCHGTIIPTAPSLETAIEFSHRLTSGLSIWAVIALLLAAIARHAPQTPARVGAWLTFLFIITESLVGAGIVLLEYVADNQSYARAGWMAVHLINTFLLAGALVRTVWGARPRQASRWIPGGRDGLVLYTTIAITLVLGVTGAISALGNTLFPADPSASPLEHVLEDPWANTPYPMLVRLVHPALAMLATFAYGWAVLHFVGAERTAGERRAAKLFAASVVLQIVCGFVNIGLSAPGYMQIAHLATGHLMWAALLVLCFESGAAQSRAVVSAR
jgi:cytochrome c oxidase assembly protein subunit 15